jgi:hypothetical protein
MVIDNKMPIIDRIKVNNDKYTIIDTIMLLMRMRENEIINYLHIKDNKFKNNDNAGLLIPYYC